MVILASINVLLIILNVKMFNIIFRFKYSIFYENYFILLISISFLPLWNIESNLSKILSFQDWVWSHDLKF